MVRNTTKEDRKTAQWFAAWELLPRAAREAVAKFCALADADVAAVALKV